MQNEIEQRRQNGDEKSLNNDGTIFMKCYLGHSSTSTTEIYLLEEVQEAMKVAKALSS